ncbi:MAG: 3-phosphoshikimate 1-carboxyvinyltransferase [Candidatus Dadabacteria bacterium]|nr:MAG: 3-phosphoshikimate 1-carboxyvinyltransferase [Candidatus Dadabacteria bacterium]
MSVETIHPAYVKGVIKAPLSKSVLQRAIMLAALTEGETKISIGNPCDDVASALEAASQLGAAVEINGEKVSIKGFANPPHSLVYCGKSALCARVASIVASLYKTPITISGDKQLCSRPAFMIEEALSKAGCNVKSTGGYFPITVCGPLRGGTITLDCSLTSQHLSGFLMALPLCSEDSEVHVEPLFSAPYARLTQKMVAERGGNIYVEDSLRIWRISGGCKFHPVEVMPEGDWSGASFLLCAAALKGEITVTGLRSDTFQGDKEIVEVLKIAGASVECEDSSVSVRRNTLRPFVFDAADFPDLVPPLVALASSCKGESVLIGVSRLAYKESNRIKALIEEFLKLGIDIHERDGNLVIKGGIARGGEVSSRGDHRIAMALAIAALRAKGSVKITGSECVSKSYPSFFGDLRSCLTV